MSDAIRRGLRTFLWALAAAVPGIPTIAQVFNIPAGRVAQVTAVMGTLTAIVTAIYNALEDKGVAPVVLGTKPDVKP